MALAQNCEVRATQQGRELAQHGTAWFPLAAYQEDLTCFYVPWHWHDDFEYILAARGTVTVGVGKSRLYLHQGQGVLINCGGLHEVETVPEGPSLLRSLVFHPRLVGGMDTVFWQKLVSPLQAPGAPAYVLLDAAVPWQAQALECFRDAWRAVSTDAMDYENWARYRICTALRLINQHCAACTDTISQQEQVASRRMKRMLRFIEEHYVEELTVARIADSVALSESACLRSFRQMLGLTPIQYVKQYRIEKAAEMLLTTRLKAGEIGAACGFSDMSYFTKSFREAKHCTPKEYQRRFAGKEREGEPTDL